MQSNSANSRDEVRKLLASGRKTVALVAPSIASEFDDITDYRKFVGMLRAMGFDYVHENSFGVDLIAAEYSKLFKKAEGKYYMTANCPVIVKLIEKYPSRTYPQPCSSRISNDSNSNGYKRDLR